MKNTEERTISFEEALEMPEYVDFHEVIRYLQKTPPEDVFPEKFQASLKRAVIEKTESLFDENSLMPLKNVVTTILGGLSEELSAKLLLKMTQLIIKKWEKLSETVWSEKINSQLV